MKVENSLVKIEETIAGVDITFKVGPPAHRGHLSRHLNSLTVDEFGALAKAIAQMRAPYHWHAGYNAALVDAAGRLHSGHHHSKETLLAMRLEAVEDLPRPATGPVTIEHPTKFLVAHQHRLMLHDHELDALIAWHRDQQYACESQEDYLQAHDHKRRREELEKMKGGGKSG